MTVILNFIDEANEDPYVNPLLNQSNAGSSSVSSSGHLQQKSISTENFFTYSGVIDKTQSVTVTLQSKVDAVDFYSSGRPEIRCLYQDTSNYVRVDYYNNGANDKWLGLASYVGGVETDHTAAAGLNGLADDFLQPGDTLTLDISWAGANATFTVKKNSVTVGTPITVNSFSLTTGTAGYVLRENSSGRSSTISTMTITGDTASSSPVPIFSHHLRMQGIQ